MSDLIKYAGYVSWHNVRLQRVFTKCVSVVGPTTLDAEFYGDGSQVFDAIEAKARKRWPKAICNEVWRV